MKTPDTIYTSFDPFEGDRDSDVRLRNISLVTTRKTHRCMSPGGDVHEIPPGTRARRETALVDRERWGSYYVCTSCIDSFLLDFPGFAS